MDLKKKSVSPQTGPEFSFIDFGNGLFAEPACEPYMVGGEMWQDLRHFLYDPLKNTLTRNGGQAYLLDEISGCVTTKVTNPIRVYP